MTHSNTPTIFADWMAALEARHLANLRLPEVTRALRALSASYVERRRRSDSNAGDRAPVAGVLDSAGKRAAFAVFYGPLHFLGVWHAVTALQAASPTLTTVVDLGCGTGVAGAAWAVAASPPPRILGIDRHPWAVQEARWTYRQLGLHGVARRADAARMPPARPGTGIIVGYLLNELPDAERRRLEDRLIAAAGRDARVLIIEPIARAVVPWWDQSAARVVGLGGRADQWRFRVELPPLLRLLDRAAGLDHRELTLRTLYLGSERPFA
jgi:protein-L-isoaspartate O-methyltransferase